MFQFNLQAHSSIPRREMTTRCQVQRLPKKNPKCVINIKDIDELLKVAYIMRKEREKEKEKEK